MDVYPRPSILSGAVRALTEVGERGSGGRVNVA